jgi:hypothetical protein
MTVISTASRLHEALLHEVLEAAGAGDDDVDAAQRRLLGVLADAAEDRGHAQARGLGQQGDGRGDLRRELAGRREDEAARVLRPGLDAGEARHEREREGEGLAAAGAATAEQVAAGEVSGRVPCWIGKASVLPSAARTEASSAGTPSSRRKAWISPGPDLRSHTASDRRERNRRSRTGSRGGAGLRFQGSNPGDPGWRRDAGRSDIPSILS